MFVYAADTWCDACGEAIRRRIVAAGEGPQDPDDECSFDSDAFPKHACSESTDGPDHCAAVGECLGDAVDLRQWCSGPCGDDVLVGAESWTIGEVLSEGLTDEGCRCLAGMLADEGPESTPYQHALYACWREVFADDLLAYRGRL